MKSGAVDIALIGSLAVLWLTAGLIADGLPASATAAALHRRATLLTGVIAAGTAMLVAVPLVNLGRPGPEPAGTAIVLVCVPVAVVLTVGVRRLARVRRGAAALATAPLAPIPPGLTAGAAHPLIVVPTQVAGLAAVAGLPIAAGVIDVSTALLVAVVGGVAGLVAVAIAIRHGVRHSRLSVGAIAPIKRRPKQLVP
ncbi:hypothetical protein [Actinoplanes sp. NPDC049265]|uniref:hypothetical protein n=1 Tax=Actinoplanes sp. NPDC049265 TaxID=3363902 RepID=UPI003720AB1E